VIKVRTSLSGTEMKNLMERFIHQHIKDRTECFDDHFLEGRRRIMIGSICMELVGENVCMYLRMGMVRI
jgi:hypothetical protein